ncbi:hypothetical protein [Schauerella aestuarii]|uniref:hypothetical protein n=1 Tax=Schauerella aestuarii TaxID=2511204 RepID=UPI00136AC73D|nr:hypothetical protein [Achromobacter aestuarii]MYZ45644.1 hypothetical protein [Achromobacter aestuarii]
MLNSYTTRPAYSWSRSTLAIILLVGVNGVGHAQIYGQPLKDSLFGSMTKEENAAFTNASAKALNNAKDGAVTLWQSPSTRKTAISGQVYADGTAAPVAGNTCRKLHATFMQGTARENWLFSMCRQPDGKWKAASQTKA